MKAAAFALLLLPLPAHATYMSDCIIEGVVTNTPVLELPNDADTEGPAFEFRVTGSKPPPDGARNDGDCRAFMDEVLAVTLPSGSAMPVQGDRLTLRLMEFDTEDIPRTRTFTLAPPAR